MAKSQSFARKSKKVKHVEKCPDCFGDITLMRLCVSIPCAGGCRFKDKMVKVCQCRPLEDYVEGKIK